MWFGIVMGLLASASWAAANVFVQRSSRALGPFRALVWTQVVGGLAVVPAALLLDVRPSPIDLRLLAWVAFAGLASVVAYASMFWSYERGRLAVVVPVMSSWSVIAAAFSIVVLRQHLRGNQLAGAALVAAGVVIVSRFVQRATVTGGETTTAGAVEARRSRAALLTAAAAAGGFGLLIPTIDRLAPAFGRLGTIPVVFAADLILGLPLALAARIELRPPPRAAWPAVLGAALFETVGFVWIALGVSRAPVAIVSPLAGLASAFTVAFAWIVLGERPAPPLFAGAALVCAGVVVMAL
jgi:drug/metabolite transporter (DMT)-like permease